MEFKMKTASKIVVLAIVATMIIFTALSLKEMVNQQQAKIATYTEIQ